MPIKLSSRDVRKAIEYTIIKLKILSQRLQFGSDDRSMVIEVNGMDEIHYRGDTGERRMEAQDRVLKVSYVCNENRQKVSKRDQDEVREQRSI